MRGIPIAVLMGFLIQTLSVIGVGGWMARGVVAQQEKFAEALAAVRVDIGEIKGQVAGLTNTVQSGNVPTAINSRRIEDLERQVGVLNQMGGKVIENERRLSVMELRARARGER